MTEAKRYLIYVDILGFQDLAVEIAQKTGIKEDVIRENFLSRPLRIAIDDIGKRTGVSRGISQIEGSDSYVIILNDLESTFLTVCELSRIGIHHEDYETIPLEIAIGTCVLDTSLPIEPINRAEIIQFLKNDIINPYREYCKREFNEKLRTTFVVATEDFVLHLEPPDRKYCGLVPHVTKRFYVLDLDAIRQRCKMFSFLNKIGATGNKWYSRIDSAYVKPLEYEDMSRALRENRFLFITGTQEYGKTYTAVRFLWEFYREGYEPIWFKGGEPQERIEVRRRLENITSILKPGKVIYFEDPFGKLEYERRETLEREIGTIVQSVRQQENVYVIITSREEVFKQFKKEMIPANELSKFEKQLSIKRPSYDSDRRLEILFNLAEIQGCKWFRNNELKQLIARRLEYRLPTPLAIREFVISTTENDTIHSLLEIMEIKSRDTSKSFAQEIMSMSDDKLYFLSILFALRMVEVGDAEELYEKSIASAKLAEAWQFDRMLAWFQNDKVTVASVDMMSPSFIARMLQAGLSPTAPDTRDNPRYLEFSHSSYYSALDHVLIEDGYFTRVNEKIFTKVLLLVCEEYPQYRNQLSRTLEMYFDRLPENTRTELLLRALKWVQIPQDMADAIEKYFVCIREDVRDEMLFKLSNDDATIGSVARILCAHYDNVPISIRNRLLQKLAKIDYVARYVAEISVTHFKTIPKHLRELVFRFSKDDKTAWVVAEAILRNYDRLPENLQRLIHKLSGDAETAADVALAVMSNFNVLPEDLRIELMLSVSGNDLAAMIVATTISSHFDEFSDDERNRLLLHFLDNGKAAWVAAHVIGSHFTSFSRDARNRLILRISENDEAVFAFSKAVRTHVDELPASMKGKVLDLVGTVPEH